MRFLKQQILTAALFLLTVSQLVAQVNPEVNFRRITINDGLSLSSVYKVYQDKKGFMWFSTEDGLNKFDGRRFDVYNHTPGDEGTISYKWIESITEDKQGALWLGSRKGLSRLDPKTDRIDVFHPDNPGKRISNDTIIVSLEQGDHIWVGTMSGLDKIDSKSLEVEQISFQGTTGLPKILSLEKGLDNSLWIGTDHGIYIVGDHSKNARKLVLNDAEAPLEVFALKYSLDTLWVGTQNGIHWIFPISSDEDSWQIKSLPTSSPVETIFIDTQRKKWIVSSDELLLMEDSTTKSIVQTPHRTPSLEILPKKPILEDKTGRIWFGSYGEGAFLIKGNKPIPLNIRHDARNENSLSDNTVNCIYEDRAGGIWFGTYGAGISVFDPSSMVIKTLKHNPFESQSMSSNFVWTVTEDEEGKVWIGTNNTGINIFNPKDESFEFLTHDPGDPQSLPDASVRKIFLATNGTIWVGTDGGGLSKYQPGTKKFKHFRHYQDDPESISSNFVRTIYEDTTGMLWIGTQAGLNKFDPYKEKFTSYKHDPNNSKSLSNNFIYSAILMDSRGDLWIGTYGGGLNKLSTSTGEFTSYHFDPDDPSSISDDIVFDIYEDEKGYFWIGTNSGLNLFNPSTGKFKRYGEESGLPNEVIYGIMPDQNNMLWMTTNKGISRLDLTEFRFKNFDVRDGLQSNEFNGGAFHKGKSGKIYAGGVYGLNIIDPEKIKPVDNSAELIISRLEILGKEVKILQPGMIMDSTRIEDEVLEMVQNYYVTRHTAYIDIIRLDYSERYFSLEFTALNHHHPEKLNFRYRMNGLHEHWNYAGNRNYVTYANMKPGSYIFEADAINADGKVASSPAQLKIIIKPPFWRSYWFMLLMALFITMVIVFIYRFLLNQRMNSVLKEQNTMIKETNTQLQISENNLKELNATKDKFFSIISHDLKNPFTSVLSISELLADNFELTQEDELKYGIKKIHETNQHIYALLENLLTWSKSQRGNITLEKSDFSLSRTIETNINVLRLAAEKKHISFINEASGDLIVHGDREMISTVFRNLLNNAVKFTPQCKKIVISTERNHKMVLVSVKDEGIGISEENLERLFRIDDKYKSDGTEGEKGTGLGLIICKEFIEKNGGSINVKSTPGTGSTFSFTIPLGTN